MGVQHRCSDRRGRPLEFSQVVLRAERDQFAARLQRTSRGATGLKEAGTIKC
jgi:hypothetical protein